MTLEDFFVGQAESRRIFESLRHAADAYGPAELHITKSQVTFRRRRAFAWTLYAIQLSARQARAASAYPVTSGPKLIGRWKEIVEPAPGRFTHHLELYSTADIDDEVRTWLQKAWAAA